MIAVGIAFAVLAACCYAVSATLQHHAVHTVSDGSGRLRMAQLGTLARRRKWLLGLLVMCCGAGLHVVSLSLAPLMVVQPVGVLSIGLAALLAARTTKSRPDRATVFAVLATAAGVGLFLLFAAPHANPAAVPAMAAGRVLPVTGAVVAVLVAAALAARRWARCPLFAAAAGVAYGTVSVLTRAIAQRVRIDGLAGLPLGPTVLSVLGGVAAIVAGAVCVQQAYASGRPDTVLACQTVVDPLIGVLFGVFLFHEAIGTTPAATLGQLAGGALAAAGVLALARRRSEPIKQRKPMNRPPRIIIGADTYPPDINGAATFAHQLAAGLAHRDHDVHVLCPSDTGPPGVSTIDGVTVHRLPAHGTPCHPTFRVCLPWQTGRAAGALLDELTPDLVHVQSHFSVGRALVHAATERHVPLVATNHFMPENLYDHLRIPTWLRRPAARLAWWDLVRVFRPVKVVTAPTPTAVNLLRDKGCRAVPVSCGVDLDRFGTDKNGDGRTILFVGRLDEEKRVHELLHALALLPQRLNARVELVGDGACRPALTALTQRLGITDRVRFRGFVSADELVAAYRTSAVFCMPGVAELQSLATMEAMAAGRPIVAANAVALPHLVLPGRNGWLYPPGDVHALAERLTALFDQPGALVGMGAVSRELIGRHDVRSSLDTYETLYRAAIGNGDDRPTDGDRQKFPEIVLPRVSIAAAAVRP